MKFEIFNFESITSTNDAAINLIKNKKKVLVAFMPKIKQKVEEPMEINGFQ